MDQEAPFVGLTFIDGTMTTAEVALAVVRKQFLAMVSKHDGTLAGNDPEDLHDMRVATRRMRAATSLFRSFLSERVLACREEFAWLGEALGHVRDLDVQLEHVRGWSEELPGGDPERLAPFIRVLRKRREAARKEMVESLCSDRYNALVETFPTFLKEPPGSACDAPVTLVGPELIEKRMRSFNKASIALTPHDAPQRFHLARIRAKKIRYAMEFLAPVYGKVAKDASLRIVAVQDLLGLHQDCVVAIALVDEVVESERFPSRTAFRLGMLRQFLEDRAASFRVRFPELLKESHGKEWHALREAMDARIPVPEEPAQPADAI